MATIQARPDRHGRTRYRVQIRLGPARASATFATLAAARRWATVTEGALRTQRQFPTLAAAHHTLSAVLVRYERDVLPTKSPQTAVNQAIHLAWWQAQLGSTLLLDLTPARLTACRDRLAQDRAPATVNRYLSTLSHTLHVAVTEWQWLEESPLRRVRRLREPRGRVRYLSEDERTRLLQACQASSTPALYPLVVLALATGARKMELLRLTWREVDLRRAQIALEQTKNRERRALPLTGLALQEVERLAKVRRLDTLLVFPRADGRQPLDIRYAWAQALRAAGIADCRFHDLRHSCASYLAMQGASLVEIAAVLGHKTLQMVQRYTHLSDAHTAGVVARMTAAIFAEEQRSG
jgi:integrase